MLIKRVTGLATCKSLGESVATPGGSEDTRGELWHMNSAWTVVPQEGVVTVHVMMRGA